MVARALCSFTRIVNDTRRSMSHSMQSETPADAAIYQHPLAYLLGLQGVALFRAFAGEYDREFTEARLAEIRTLLDSADKLGEGGYAVPITTSDGYDGWAPYYDQPGNAMIDREQPIVREILDGLPVGVALDAACGTGRHTAYLASLGHNVIGVDSSPGMLAAARSKVPDGEFHQADLHRLPVPDDHVDVVVCTLALEHVPDLAAALTEFARVLRPGGHLVISDGRGLMPGARKYPLVKTGPDGKPGYMPNWIHQTSDYLKAALPLGLQVRRCEEPRSLEPMVDETGTPPVDAQPVPPHVPSDNPPNIWSLHPWAPAATNAAYRDKPHFIVWHFQLADS
jgi:ubiquinone/menaquinone biosynthesis C-methylase UbiE